MHYNKIFFKNICGLGETYGGKAKFIQAIWVWRGTTIALRDRKAEEKTCNNGGTM